MGLPGMNMNMMSGLNMPPTMNINAMAAGAGDPNYMMRMMNNASVPVMPQAFSPNTSISGVSNSAFSAGANPMRPNSAGFMPSNLAMPPNQMNMNPMMPNQNFIGQNI